MPVAAVPATAAAEVEYKPGSPISIGVSPVGRVVARPDIVGSVARVAIGRTRRVGPAMPPLQRVLRIVLLGDGAECRLRLGCRDVCRSFQPEGQQRFRRDYR